MGQYDFSAQRVHHAATQLLSTSRLKHPPPWYNVLSDIPPPQLLVRPAFKAGDLVSQKQSQLPKKLKKGKRPSRMFQPVNIPRGLEHDLRETFFAHHPWELARPRVVLENDGRDAEKWDWSKGITQPGKPLDGESVVQRQVYFKNIKPPHAFANAETKERAERTVVIRNIPNGTDAKDVQAFFTECGHIEALEVHGQREAALEPHEFAELVTTLEPGTGSRVMGDSESRANDIAGPETTETITSEPDVASAQNAEISPNSIIASIRFSTLEQAVSAMQKSGSPIKPSTPPLLVRRLAQAPHTLFITGIPLSITSPSALVEGFSSAGNVTNPHIILSQSAPHSPTGCGFITMRTPAQAAAAKSQFLSNRKIVVYDFPLSSAQCYDIARKEFYKHRHFADIERKVAAEEARATGAWFPSSPNAIALGLEDVQYDDWKAWAMREAEKAKQEQDSMMTGLDDDDAILDDGEEDTATEELADSVPRRRQGQTALGGAVAHP